MTPEASSRLHGETSECPLAHVLDLIGDRWTAIVLRDLLYFDRRTFGELLESGEGISSNILSNRLKRLTEFGLVEKRAYQHKPTRYRYEPTPAAIAFVPVLNSLIAWGMEHIGCDDGEPPPGYMEALVKNGFVFPEGFGPSGRAENQ